MFSVTADWIQQHLPLGHCQVQKSHILSYPATHTTFVSVSQNIMSAHQLLKITLVIKAVTLTCYLTNTVKKRITMSQVCNSIVNRDHCKYTCSFQKTAEKSFVSPHGNILQSSLIISQLRGWLWEILPILFRAPYFYLHLRVCGYFYAIWSYVCRSGGSHLVASLGHTERRRTVLGCTWHTLPLTTADELK